MGNIFKPSAKREEDPFSEPPKSKPIEFVQCETCGRHKNFNLDAGSVYVHKFSKCEHTICRDCYVVHLKSKLDNAIIQEQDELEINCFHD